MSKTVFFSWQSDTQNTYNKNFLRTVLDDACAVIASDTTVDEAERENVEVDSDTQDIPGQPPIMDTIFGKIDTCGVFVADVSFTATRIDGRPSPNPNVLIEYGWALNSLKYSRVISIMNTAYGVPTRENLPFDLGHLRFPITYCLSKKTTSEERKKEKKRLTDLFVKAIRASLATLPAPYVEPEPKFPEAEAKNGSSRFRAHGEPIGFYSDLFGRKDVREIFISATKPAMWLRVMPTKDVGKTWSTDELKQHSIENNRAYLAPLMGGGSYDFLRAEDGMGIFRPSQGSDVGAVAFAFETGEVWSIDTDWLEYGGKSKLFFSVEKYFSTSLKDYSDFLKLLGIEGPFRWKAGISGVKGLNFNFPVQSGYSRVGDGPICVADTIEEDGIYDDSTQSPTSALLPFFKKIFSKCGIKRPDYLPQE